MTREGGLLRAVLAEPAVPDPPPPATRDVVLAALAAVAVVIELLVRPDVLWPVLTGPFALAAAAGLVWRRVHPFGVLAGVAGFSLVLEIAQLVAGNEDEAPYALVFVLILPYALARWGSGRGAVGGLALMLAGGVLSVVTSGGPTGEVVAEAVAGFALLFATIALGLAVRARATARRRELERVRSAERVDLARDLHDTVAHHVSAIAIRAEAGRSAAAVDPDAAVGALADIQAEAGRALDEMRAMVRVLRTESASYVPQPGVADLERLGEGPGLRVEVRRGAGVVGLSGAVDQALYRIAQESVTNARRHANGARVVRVDVSLGGPGEVHLEVSDDGGPVGPGGVGGQGLVGMAERAALLGGRLEAGPRPGGGWTVRAVLPVTPADASNGDSAGAPGVPRTVAGAGDR